MSNVGKSGDEPPISEVLNNARRAVDDFRRRLALQGHEASEEEQTLHLCDSAWPRVEYARFNRQEEAKVGADWLWWFLGGDECFGILVQAKRLRGRSAQWELDLAYPQRTGEQMRRLLATSDRHGVPAGYIVYFGDADRRPDLQCEDHAEHCCHRCDRSSVALLPALAARKAIEFAYPSHPEELVPNAYRYSFPLEDIGRRADQRVFDVNFRHLPTDLKRFLIEPQTGPRAVAKHIFKVAADIRSAQFTASSAVLTRTDSQQVFRDLPTDTGRGGPPYWMHNLRGLRTSPPGYVVAFLSDPGTTEVPADIDGLVVVHM